MKRNLAQTLEISIMMAKRDISIKYKRSWFGVLWSLLNPLVLVFVYTFAFKIVLKSSIENFPLFLLIGLAPWTLFNAIINSSSNIIVGNSNLISKLYFNRSVLIYSNMLFNLFFYGMTLLIILISTMILGLEVNMGSIGLILLATILLLLFTMGIAFFVATISVRLRDIPHLIEVALMALFWVTPVVYDISSVPEDLNLFTEINPIACIIGIFRHALLGYDMPSNIVTSVVMSVLIFASGLYYFKRKEKYFVEYL